MRSRNTRYRIPRSSLPRPFRFALWLLPLYGLLGQEPIKTPRPRVNSLRFSVVSNVAPVCASAAGRVPLEPEAENQLRTFGFAVSKVYNARLAISVDCAAAHLPSQTASLAVHECLALSELDGTGTHASQFAATFRECQSFICDTPQCGPMLHA